MVDLIKNREVHLVINTPLGHDSQIDDSYIRKAAVKYKMPYMTTLTAALAAARGIESQRATRAGVRSLQAYHESIV
jgi:carbamoyl-phosphate synthase large subunit